MEYQLFDTLADDLLLGIEYSPSVAKFQAFRLARGLKRPIIVEGFGVHCAIAPDGSELPQPQDWLPPS